MDYLRETKIKIKKKSAKCILTALMAFFDTVGPVWNFFFLKTPNPDERNDEISVKVMKF